MNSRGGAEISSEIDGHSEQTSRRDCLVPNEAKTDHDFLAGENPRLSPEGSARIPIYQNFLKHLRVQICQKDIFVPTPNRHALALHCKLEKPFITPKKRVLSNKTSSGSVLQVK
jgi:hypothetical protein